MRRGETANNPIYMRSIDFHYLKNLLEEADKVYEGLSYDCGTQQEYRRKTRNMIFKSFAEYDLFDNAFIKELN